MLYYNHSKDKKKKKERETKMNKKIEIGYYAGPSLERTGEECDYMISLKPITIVDEDGYEEEYKLYAELPYGPEEDSTYEPLKRAIISQAEKLGIARESLCFFRDDDWGEGR